MAADDHQGSLHEGRVGGVGEEDCHRAEDPPQSVGLELSELREENRYDLSHHRELVVLLAHGISADELLAVGILKVLATAEHHAELLAAPFNTASCAVRIRPNCVLFDPRKHHFGMVGAAGAEDCQHDAVGCEELTFLGIPICPSHCDPFSSRGLNGNFRHRAVVSVVLCLSIAVE
eukprot:GDKK01049802.1.p2 GENE.GDKK01049802.1~~GDKK01049802.1.p2  ORF type:complete len:176 (+),score=8.69 GDKK01049802.1:1464-1991(+)